MRLVPLAVLLTLVLPEASYAYTFVDGRGSRCDVACEARSMKAVTSGKYTPNGESFFVCAGQGGDEWRPGYNLAPNWTNTCMVGWGGKEIRRDAYRCLCQ